MSIGGRIASVWSALVGGPSASKPTGNVPDLADYLLNHPFMPAVNFDDYSEAFKKVPIVQQCTRQIQHDVASLPVRVYQVRGEVKTEVPRKPGNLVDLLASANRVRDTGYQLMRDTVGAYILHGNAAWFLQRPKSRQKPPSGPPDELWTLPWQNWRATPTENRGILIWEYLRGGGWEAVDAANVIHFRDYNPDDSVLGFSRIEPVRREFEAQFYALCLLRDFFKDGGRVGGVYTPRDAAVSLGTGGAQAIQDKLHKLRGDRSKTFRDTVIDAALEYVRLGASLSEMELDKNLSIINASIARSIGVPPMRLGIKEGGGTLSDSGSAQTDAQNYWFGTIGQVTADISTVLTERLAPLFGPNLVIEFDMRGVLPVQAAKMQQAATLVSLVAARIYTRNEARQVLGDAPAEDPTADEFNPIPAPAPTLGPSPNNEPNSGNGEAPRPAQDAGSESKAKQQARLSKSEREMLRRHKNAELVKVERVIESHFRARFAKQFPLIEASVRAHASALGFSGGRTVKGIAIAPVPLPIELPDDEESMQKLVDTLLLQVGESELAKVGIQIEFNAHSARAADFARRVARKMLDWVDDTTLFDVQNLVATGLGQGETLAQIIERIGEYATTCSDVRSALIARTEGTRAYNFAANEAWQQSGVVTQQEWLTARDGLGGRHAEDPLYADLDGQVVGLEDRFHVGDDWLAYPGDPDAPVGATANCRCTLLPAGIDEGLRRTLNERAQWESFMAAPKPSKNGHSVERDVWEWVTR